MEGIEQDHTRESSWADGKRGDGMLQPQRTLLAAPGGGSDEAGQWPRINQLLPLQPGAPAVPLGDSTVRWEAS